MKRLFVMGLLFMFMAVAPVVSLFAAEPEVATNSGPISSVTVAGLVAQNGTPTPTTPIDIVSNNGVLKVSKNLANFNDVAYNSQFFSIDKSTGTLTGSGSDANFSFWLRDAKANTTYIISANYITIGNLSNFQLRDSNNTAIITGDVFSTTGVHEFIFSIPADGDYRINMRCAGNNSSFVANNIQIEKGSTATPYMPYGEIYTDGEVETIADSANHTATVATLLGVGDYRDTQNINTGAITRKVGVKVLDGTEPLATSDVVNMYSLDVPNLVGTTETSRLVYCTHFKNSSTLPATSDRQGYCIKGHSSGRSYISFGATTQFPNFADFQSYLAEQYAAGTPVIVIYPLATETTESVAGQTMTTAPVNNRTGGVTGMTITTLLSSDASVVTTIAANAIKIATTAYNSARFSPVVTDLNSAVATIREIVTKTINQTAAIASLQADKQTRPEDACPAGKKCLLVETEENGVIVPHWFPIIEAPENTE